MTWTWCVLLFWGLPWAHRSPDSWNKIPMIPCELKSSYYVRMSVTIMPKYLEQSSRLQLSHQGMEFKIIVNILNKLLPRYVGQRGRKEIHALTSHGGYVLVLNIYVCYLLDKNHLCSRFCHHCSIFSFWIPIAWQITGDNWQYSVLIWVSR